MALATNSTPGSVILAGDLTGNANAPQLRITGVVPGSYTTADVVVDDKGRLVYAKNGSFASPGDATTTSLGIVQLGSGLDTTSGILAIPNATTSSTGVVQVGANLTISGDVLSINDASASNKGLVQIGSGLTVSGGVVSVNDASASTKGLVQIGSGLTVSGGVVSVDTSNPPVATTSTKGVVQVGTGFAVASGTITPDTATTASKGVVQVGTGFTVSAGSVSVNASLVGKLNSSTSWTGTQYTPVKTLISGDSSVDLSAANDFYTASSASQLALIAPTNATTNTFNIIADCGTVPSFVWKNTSSYSLSGGTGGSAVPTTSGRFWCFDTASTTSVSLGGATGSDITQGTMPASGSWRPVNQAGNPTYLVNGYYYAMPALSASTGARSGDGGATWASFSWSGASQWQSIAYGGGMYVVMSYTGNNTTNYAYSSNGTTWTTSTLPASDVWSKCFYLASAGLFLAFGLTNYAYSSNGTSWTLGSLPASGYSNAYHSNGVVYLCSGSYTNTVYKTTNGTTWTAITMPSTTGWSISTVGGLTIAHASSSNQFLFSGDGNSWTTRSLPTSGLLSIAGSAWFCVPHGGTTVYVSTDSGASWGTNITGTYFSSSCTPSYDGVQHVIVDRVNTTSVRIITSTNNFSSFSSSTITWSIGTSSQFFTFGNTSTNTTTIVLNNGNVWGTLTTTGLPLSFSSSYKFNNAPPPTGFTTISCTVFEGTTYCTFK